MMSETLDNFDDYRNNEKKEAVLLTLGKEELDMLSLAVLSQMTRLVQAYVSTDLKDAIDKELKELQKLHKKICEAMKC